MLLTGSLIIYLFLLVYVIGKIFKYVRNPSKTMSWLLVVILVPGLGIFLYFLMGKSTKKDKIFLQRSPFYRITGDQEEVSGLPVDQQLLSEMLHKNNSAALSFGNRVTILQDGADTYKHIFAAMRRARSTIHLDFYILEEGKNLDECLSICRDKINEGVTVRLIYDGFGTFMLSRKCRKKIKNIGIQSCEFFPFHLFGIFKFINYRNHRKIVIVDNEVAFTGGMNISDKYTKPHKRLGLWRDTFIRIEGPAAPHFEHVFRTDWYYANGPTYTLPVKPVESFVDGAPVQVIASGPDSEFQGILQEYFAIIADAKKYVYIVTPYFVPGEAIMTALKTSAMSGVDVRLLLPFDSDFRWMKWCIFTYIEELLAAKVRVYLFHGGFLHSKVIVSDDIVSSVGTANMDDRSFKANFEVNALVYDPSTAGILKSKFYEDLNQSEELTLSKFPHRSDRNHLMEPIARLTSSLL